MVLLFLFNTTESIESKTFRQKHCVFRTKKRCSLQKTHLEHRPRPTNVLSVGFLMTWDPQKPQTQQHAKRQLWYTCLRVLFARPLAVRSQTERYWVLKRTETVSFVD